MTAWIYLCIKTCTLIIIFQCNFHYYWGTYYIIQQAFEFHTHRQLLPVPYKIFFWNLDKLDKDKTLKCLFSQTFPSILCTKFSVMAEVCPFLSSSWTLLQISLNAVTHFLTTLSLLIFSPFIFTNVPINFSCFRIFYTKWTNNRGYVTISKIFTWLRNFKYS